MLAETLALALVLAAPGSTPPRAAPALQPDNAARARRGLLPRKVVRTQAPRPRRIVRTQAPTWLGEPGEAARTAVVVAPAADGGAEAATAIEPAQAPDPAWPIRAAADAVAVEWRVVRHAGEGRPLRATVSDPDVELVVMRRRPPPP